VIKKIKADKSDKTEVFIFIRFIFFDYRYAFVGRRGDLEDG
jgi:hypothetical protein